MAQNTAADDAQGATELTKSELVHAVADDLQSVGYEADPLPRLGVLNVLDPSDSGAMYDRVSDITDEYSVVLDVKMLSNTKFQIDPDCKDRLE